MIIDAETVRNNSLKFRTKRDFFAYRWVDLLLFFSFNFSCFEHIEFLPVIRGIRNFVSLFGRFRFWAPTLFLEVICPRYGPEKSPSLSVLKCHCAYLVLRAWIFSCSRKYQKDQAQQSQVVCCITSEEFIMIMY